MYGILKQRFATRTMDTQWSLFSLKSRIFGLEQTNWADKFWGIWGIFGQIISTHFDKVSPLPMISIIQPLFLHKKLSISIHIPNIYLGLSFVFGSQRIRDIASVCPYSVLCKVKMNYKIEMLHLQYLLLIIYDIYPFPLYYELKNLIKIRLNVYQNYP